MRKVLLKMGALTCFIGISVSALGQHLGDESSITEYANGSVYKNGRFVSQSLYVRNGVFIDSPKNGADKKIDLRNKFVVPGFAEAHHHTVLCNDERINQFLDAGIVYAAIMNSTVSSKPCQKKLHDINSLEVINSLAGITERNAHPSQIGLYFLDEHEIEGEWVHYVNSVSELKTVWPRVLQSNPDIVKIFLSYTEEYETLKKDTSVAPWYKGIHPKVAVAVVEKAHKSRLRVVAHVISANDFEVAVKAGVDLIGHMPGFAPGTAFTENDTHPWLSKLEPQQYLISPSAAVRAARQGTAVITTVSGGERSEAIAKVIAKNFETLTEAGVTLLIGSDRGEFNSVDEVSFLVEHNLMTLDDALYSISVSTPEHLFPNRKIAHLDTEMEATFVVLSKNPLVDFDAIRQVEWVVKHGVVLRGPQE